MKSFFTRLWSVISVIGSYINLRPSSYTLYPSGDIINCSLSQYIKTFKWLWNNTHWKDTRQKRKAYIKFLRDERCGEAKIKWTV